VKKKRRETEVFSLSFLDVITCGFGAIILLLMIAKTGDMPILEPSDMSLDGVIRDLQTQLFEIRGKARILNRDLNAKHEQISVWEDKVARLNTELTYIKNKKGNLKDESSVATIITGKFELALQKLTKEMQRLLAQKNIADPNIIGGIPVDSEYIIFIIDTSGSMQQRNWNKMINQLITTLDIYPEVKGIQIMSDMGSYMFSQYRRKWMPDTKGRRKVIINTLRSWAPFSNSSPVEGITEAIRHFYDPNKKISIYVFGDDFRGYSVNHVVGVVDRLNPEDAKGNRKVRIHAVGFPLQNDKENFNFARLMRELASKNGGTFVGLN